MKQDSYSQEKSEEKVHFEENQGKSGQIRQNQGTIFIVCGILYFLD